MKKLKLEELGRIDVNEFKNTRKVPVTIILDDVRSMFNVGSIFRTADAFLIEKILLCGITPTPPHRDIHKTALGATESVDWEYHKNVIDAVINLKRKGYKIYGIEQTDESIALDEVETNHNDKIAMILGNEVAGINNKVIELLDKSIEIPQFGTKHSLNVSIAAGICIYKVCYDMIKKMPDISQA
jgi:23S rRNA (guanosine2251-2'-O)-methyltransferase